MALWAGDARDSKSRFVLNAEKVTDARLLCLHLTLPSPVYPDISGIFPCACRMQRTVFDMLGVAASGSQDARPWLRHGAWPETSFPLRKDFDAAISQEAEDYPFVQVEGQGVHEIPVGPVHAGIIEPGHFRFSIIGERVLRLEERLGYVHKGVEKRFENNSLAFGAKLAGRVSGDSTVAYAWAYAMAAESIANVVPPKRALWLRALLLERERIANHLGDLGYLSNDVAFSFGMSQFWILKEQVLRNNAALFGHRYLMDKIIPGGVSVDLTETATLLAECDLLEHEVRLLHSILEEHAGVQDRYIGAGTVEPALAAQWGWFYVSPDRAYVRQPGLSVYVEGCGFYLITRNTDVPIANNHFAFSGDFYGEGTFNSATQARVSPPPWEPPKAPTRSLSTSGIFMAIPASWAQSR